MLLSKSRMFLLAGILICLLPIMNPARALILGIVGTIFFKNRENLQPITGLLLKSSIILLGFGLNWSVALASASNGAVLTAATVIFTLVLGVALRMLLKTDKKTGLLISVGTAICGGSAIAAMSPVIEAKSEQMSFSLVVVFVLNGIALLVFPIIGSQFDLSQEVFGTWAAIAIHDTSSVVGAAAIYGDTALEIATTTKLTRALWILPMIVLYGVFSLSGDWKRIRVPWFILLFVLAVVAASRFPQHADVFEILNQVGKKGMVLVLFLVGVTFNFSEIRKAGMRYFLHGFTLWLIVSVLSLWILTRWESTWLIP